jgi:hypothetical protein
MIDTMKREKYDDLYTSADAVLPLVKYLPDKWPEWPTIIWECAAPAKGSAITQALFQAGYAVEETGIESGVDFLRDRPRFDFDLIVTNPPYSQKDKFLRRCYGYRKPFALLLPITSLEGIYRGEIYREHGISLIVLDRRVDFTGKGAPWFAVGWFCWNLPGLPNNTVVFEKLGRTS